MSVSLSPSSTPVVLSPLSLEAPDECILDIALVPTSYHLPLAVLARATAASLERAPALGYRPVVPPPVTSADVAPLLAVFEPFFAATWPQTTPATLRARRSELRAFLMWARSQYLVACVEELTARMGQHWALVLKEQAAQGRIARRTARERARMARQALAWLHEQQQAEAWGGEAA